MSGSVLFAPTHGKSQVLRFIARAFSLLLFNMLSRLVIAFLPRATIF